MVYTVKKLEEKDAGRKWVGKLEDGQSVSIFFNNGILSAYIGSTLVHWEFGNIWTNTMNSDKLKETLQWLFIFEES